MIDSFILYALGAGILVAIAAGPLGCFLVWRRMAYFGDTIAHSALMGVALGFAFGTTSPVIMILVCAMVALFLLVLQRDRSLSSDTLLGILAHSALSIGLIMIALQENIRQNMMFYLIGDILAIHTRDIYQLSAMCLGVLVVMALIWKSLLSVTVHEDLARIEGIAVTRTKIIYMLMIATLVALSLKVTGVLLVTALMIIPAAGARNLARTPGVMIGLAVVIGVLSVISGVFVSSNWDVPTGPAIVLSATTVFVLSRFFCLKAA
ncbi:iron chelate uptake ABC transporter family permease subunit [Emcibacter sp.]|uniref:iron chelate uptake ABC transporter family permease subunit n=1 Tax=Emcibacter sp. TaxID=1979954 RepID=UPI002AA5FF95|nr:iron chelate uptake ABC transporter family permease subunit [Emcibacter sp.]